MGARRRTPRVSGVRQAGESRVERGHLEGRSTPQNCGRRSIWRAEFDRKIVIEAAVPQAREIEVAVLGNDEPEASVPGEIIPSREFYDYEAKYIDEGSKAVIPAALTDAQIEEVRALAVAAFKAIDGAGMARVDFLLAGDSGILYLNEVNTIPGFTTISMYSKLWEASGLSYPQLARSADRRSRWSGTRKNSTCALACER